MRRKGIKELALKLSEGLLATVTDVLLFNFFLAASSLGKSPNHYGTSKMVDETFTAIDEFNYKTIKEALANLKRRGFIRSLKALEITEAGRERLEAVLPTYQNDRPWDGIIYIIAYDIDEKNRQMRNELREFITKLGAGLLQRSVWLTPYNPQKLLKEFSQDKTYEGEIIVSCIGKDGYIGEENLSMLVERVYDLEEINDQYQEFLDNYTDYFSQAKALPKEKNKDKWNAVVSYLNILQRDPQLPWELLPENWKGDKAYQLYQNIITTS